MGASVQKLWVCRCLEVYALGSTKEALREIAVLRCSSTTLYTAGALRYPADASSGACVYGSFTFAYHAKSLSVRLRQPQRMPNIYGKSSHYLQLIRLLFIPADQLYREKIFERGTATPPHSLELL